MESPGGTWFLIAPAVAGIVYKKHEENNTEPVMYHKPRRSLITDQYNNNK